MPVSVDILALILFGFIAVITFYLHHSSTPGQADLIEQDADVFYQQKQLDPLSMEIPLTGLGEELLFSGGNAFLPAEINRLLLSKAEQDGVDVDAMGLAAAMRPGPKGDVDKQSLRLSWTITAFVILLGLIFLLLWMLTLI
jgi:hypothetical protein